MLIGSSCMKIVWAPLDKYIILYIYRILLLQLRSCLTSSVTVPYPLLLVSGTLTSYLPPCLGSLAGVFFCFICLVLWSIVNVHPFRGRCFKHQQCRRFQARFSRSFSYWEPGTLELITPSSGAEGAEIKAHRQWNWCGMQHLAKVFNDDWWW